MRCGRSRLNNMALVTCISAASMKRKRRTTKQSFFAVPRRLPHRCSRDERRAPAPRARRRRCRGRAVPIRSAPGPRPATNARGRDVQAPGRVARARRLRQRRAPPRRGVRQRDAPRRPSWRKRLATGGAVRADEQEPRDAPGADAVALPVYWAGRSAPAGCRNEAPRERYFVVAGGRARSNRRTRICADTVSASPTTRARWRATSVSTK